MSVPTPRIVVIAGPTAVGKSALALDVAERLDLAIVSADSRQVYRHLDIGTAKPTPIERARVPHHLIDFVEPDEPYSVARFRADGDMVLAQLAASATPVLVVGGTQHYLQALVDRIEPPAVEPRPELRAELEAVAAKDGPMALHTRLLHLDPASARAIPAANVRRVVRALEVTLVLGRPFSELARRRSDPRPVLRLALTMDRGLLYRRADQRVDEMLAAGWLDEVRALLAAGYDTRLPALSSTGYRELIAHIHGELGFDEALRRIRWATHAYIRRQYIWLRRRQDYEWVQADPAGYARAAQMIERYLAGRDPGGS